MKKPLNAGQNKIRFGKKIIDTDEEYLKAVENADTAKVWQMENLFEKESKQIVLDTVVFR